jgi:peptide/nickel transport system permease protein
MHMSIRESGIGRAVEQAEEAPSAPAPRRGALPRILRHPSARVALGVLAVYVLATLLGPLLLHYDPTQQQLADARISISQSHPLGTDQLGRDELTRLLYGARYSLALGFLAVIIGLVIGVPLGAISGYFGGWLDLVLQRVTDILLAFPNILLALALVAALGVGLRNVIISVGISSIPLFIRLVRSSALSIRELPYVEAARSIGTRDWLIIVRHVLPNSLAPDRVRPRLLGAGRPTADAGMGIDAGRGTQRHLQRSKPCHVPRAGHLPGRACLQPARGRPA